MTRCLPMQVFFMKLVFFKMLNFISLTRSWLYVITYMYEIKTKILVLNSTVVSLIILINTIHYYVSYKICRQIIEINFLECRVQGSYRFMFIFILGYAISCFCDTNLVPLHLCSGLSL